MKRFWITIFLALLLLGCSDAKKQRPPLNAAQVEALIPGDYIGRYYGGEEFFIVETNGQFAQVFIKSGKQVYANYGKWKLHPLRDEGYSIEFAPFMDLRVAIRSGKEPEKIPVFLAAYHEFERKIYFDMDLVYYLFIDEGGSRKHGGPDIK